MPVGICAQEYFPFPSDSARWNVEFSCAATVWEPEPECTTSHFALVGDTLIDGIEYAKLYGDYGPFGGLLQDSSFAYENSTYEGAVREDSVKKVWFVAATETLEFLYYDFALDGGDTFCLLSQYC
ncbi:MAG: hypothetical protein JKY53_07155 [Flavobacteriales bacterium]|nr:hypothetical protein [Flavobacteriales bacterium]